MNTKQFTPEGVRDIWAKECIRKKELEKELMETMYSFGFLPVETPTFEYFDVFAKETGSVNAKDLYKFFDRDGNTLVLRPDVTPQIARAVAGLNDEKAEVLRLCYQGNTYINHSAYLGRARETTQIGAELMGVKEISGDAEMIALAVECLLRGGLSEFQISIGHAGYLKALVEASGMDAETEEKIGTLLSNKNFFGVSETADALPMDESLKNLFGTLGKFYSTAKEMEALIEAAKNYPALSKVISELIELDEILKMYGVRDYVTYEPGLYSSYRYYTGVLFTGYTLSVGEPVVKGGRYDRLLAHFGKEIGAVGFALVTEPFLNALVRQKKVSENSFSCEVITYKRAELADAIKRAKRLRSAGKRVELKEIKDE